MWIFHFSTPYTFKGTSFINVFICSSIGNDLFQVSKWHNSDASFNHAYTTLNNVSFWDLHYCLKQNFSISVSQPTSCVMTHQCQVLRWYPNYSPYLCQQQPVPSFVAGLFHFLKHFASCYHCQIPTMHVMALMFSRRIFLGVTTCATFVPVFEAFYQDSWSRSMAKQCQCSCQDHGQFLYRLARGFCFLILVSTIGDGVSSSYGYWFSFCKQNRHSIK